MDDLKAPYSHLFNPQGDLTAEALWAYTHGGLNAEEMRAAQQHLATCEMCQDAADGAAMMGSKEQYLSSINALNQKVDEQTDDRRKPVFMWGYQRLAIAAILLVLLGISFLWFNNKNAMDSKTIAMNQEQATGEKAKEPETQLNKTRTTDEAPAAPSTNNKNDTALHFATITSNATTNNNTVNVTPADQGQKTYFWTSPPAEQKKADTKNTSAGTYTVTTSDGLATSNDSLTVSGTSQNFSAGLVSPSAPAKKPESEERKLREKKNDKSIAKDKAKSVGSTIGNTNGEGAKKAEENQMEESANLADMADINDIERESPGSTDYIQHYIDSLRPNKSKSSRYPVTVRLTVSTTGDVAKVDFVHAPGINAKEKGQLETVLKSLPFWKSRNKKHFTRTKKMSVTFNY